MAMLSEFLSPRHDASSSCCGRQPPGVEVRCDDEQGVVLQLWGWVGDILVGNITQDLGRILVYKVMNTWLPQKTGKLLRS
jgi:hypothetical protein